MRSVDSALWRLPAGCSLPHKGASELFRRDVRAVLSERGSDREGAVWYRIPDAREIRVNRANLTRLTLREPLWVATKRLAPGPRSLTDSLHAADDLVPGTMGSRRGIVSPLYLL